MKMFNNTKPSQLYMQHRTYERHVSRILDIYGQPNNQNIKIKSKRSPVSGRSSEDEKAFSPTSFTSRNTQYRYQKSQDVLLKNLGQSRPFEKSQEKRELIQSNVGKLERLLAIEERIQLYHDSTTTKNPLLNRSRKSFYAQFSRNNEEEYLKNSSHHSFQRLKNENRDIHKGNISMMVRLMNSESELVTTKDLRQQYKLKRKYKELHKKLPTIRKYQELYEGKSSLRGTLGSTEMERSFSYKKKARKGQKSLQAEEQDGSSILAMGNPANSKGKPEIQTNNKDVEKPEVITNTLPGVIKKNGKSDSDQQDLSEQKLRKDEINHDIFQEGKQE